MRNPRVLLEMVLNFLLFWSLHHRGSIFDGNKAELVKNGKQRFQFLRVLRKNKQTNQLIKTSLIVCFNYLLLFFKSNIVVAFMWFPGTLIHRSLSCIKSNCGVRCRSLFCNQRVTGFIACSVHLLHCIFGPLACIAGQKAWWGLSWRKFWFQRCVLNLYISSA